ncbi:MAG: glycosyl hydrolase-related protein [Acidimicrobiales bacterium]
MQLQGNDAGFPDVVVVSHFHWDREWYRTMQGFRARLVDAIDQVLDLAGDETGFRFLLDGQTVVLDDYLTVRPGRRRELLDYISDGRLAIGPWFVQPDSLLPSGESHVRNLLEGRRAGLEYGALSKVAYVPDSFGHPAQFPQLFAGFGLTGFVHWRGNGDELDELGPRWLWLSPDGTTMPVLHLTDGYFAASRPPDDHDEAVEGLAKLARRLADAGESPVILMNGFDHTRPDAGISDLVESLSGELGSKVVRGTLDDAVERLTGVDQLQSFSGELVGGRVANLLPGVWSTRMNLKIRNRRIEGLLQSWVEPWSTLARLSGASDESPAIREAWRSLLLNQAHDSICGCSIDSVHERMLSRYDDAEGLATETLDRVLQRLAGRNADRDVPSVDDLEIAVFNATGHTADAVVTVPLDAHPAFTIHLGVPAVHSLVESSDLGFSIADTPVRVIASQDSARVRWFPGQDVVDVQFVANDIPAFGYKRFRLTPSEPAPDIVDDGRELLVGDVAVTVAQDGTLTVATPNGHWSGLFGVQDIGDRGDSYDFEPVGEPIIPEPVSVEVVRRRHAAGIQELTVRRVFHIPASLTADRTSRSTDTTDVTVDITIVLAEVVPSIQCIATIDNNARDHRLRLMFPTNRSTTSFKAATTFDVAISSTRPPDSANWVHPAPTTFCHQGYVSANGLSVLAPGLPEAEVTPDGLILLTLLRSVGWLARYDLASRPMPAGPAMEAAGAQCLGRLQTEITLLDTSDPRAIQRATIGLRGVVAGPEPMLEADKSLLAVSNDAIVISALKPADDGEGIILRLLNPTDDQLDADVSLGFEPAEVWLARLDETAIEMVPLDNHGFRTQVEPHALITYRLR